MSIRLLALSAAACAAVVLAAAWVFEWPLEKAAFLAPVLVVAIGAAVGLVVLWTRVAFESLRRSRHPRRILAVSAAVLAGLVLLSLFVGPLPHE